MKMKPDEPTDEQEKVLNTFYTNGGWKYPCCKSEVGYSPNIENPGENKTQIYCVYCRQYIFLEDYINFKK